MSVVMRMVPFLRKLGMIVWYGALAMAGLYIVNGDGLTRFLSALESSNNGELLTVAQIVEAYLRYADTWNVIFIMLSFSAFMGIFFLASLLIDWMFRKLVLRYPRLGFLQNPWADILIKNPLAMGAVLLFFFIVSNGLVAWGSSSQTIERPEQVPKPLPVFVLGTSKYLSRRKASGEAAPVRKENLYYKYRIDAALELYQAGKVQYFILSGDGGDSRRDGYDETRDMREDLMAAGVPGTLIEIDTAGFRTLDSILRLRAVFHLSNILIVSQAFHTPRAMFLSKFYGLRAQAYRARGRATVAMIKREAGARPKLFMDLFFANLQPRITTADGKAFEYRKKFEVKSNLHVFILIGMITLAFSMVMGFGVYSTQRGEVRLRVLKRYALLGTTGSMVLMVMVVTAYKSEILGVGKEPMTKMSSNVERIEKPSSTVSVDTVHASHAPIQEKNESEPAVPGIDAGLVVRNGITTVASGATDLEDGLIVAATPRSNPEKSAGPDQITFIAEAHGNQLVRIDRPIVFRLTKGINIGDFHFSGDVVFYARCVVSEGKVYFDVDEIDDQPIGVQAYDNDLQRAGLGTVHFYKNTKEELVLADGQSLTFAVKTKP